MWKPDYPLPGSDVFVVNEENELLLVRRSDHGLWALPGGCQELGESPAECSVRECREEIGCEVEVVSLMGIYSSTKYPYVHYPNKNVQFSHFFFEAKILGGKPLALLEETTEIDWFMETDLTPLCQTDTKYGLSSGGSGSKKAIKFRILNKLF